MEGKKHKDQTNARHHYLPQMYLHGFTERGKIATWQRATGEVRTSSPNSVANVRGFYTFTNNDGEKSDELEKLFADVEGHVKTIIDNINSLFPPPIVGDYKLALAQYLAFQHLRTPVKRRELELTADLTMKLPMWLNLRTREQIVRALKDAGKEPTEEAILQLEEFHKDPHSVDVVPSKESVLQAQLEMLPVLTQIMLYREWHIIMFEEPSLITSDDPVLLKPDDTVPQHWMRGTGFATAKEIWFPLSSTRLLVLAHQDYKGPRLLRGTTHIAQTANNVQRESSYMEVFGPPSIIQNLEGKALGARPLTEVAAGFEKEFFEHYNEPLARPRPINR